MFVENYRRENAESIMAGAEARAMPYPRISDEDWRVWTAFLPIRSHNLDKTAASKFSTTSLDEGIPLQVAVEVERPPAVGPERLVNAVAEREAVVEDGDAGLLRRDHAAVDGDENAHGEAPGR